MCTFHFSVSLRLLLMLTVCTHKRVKYVEHVHIWRNKLPLTWLQACVFFDLFCFLEYLGDSSNSIFFQLLSCICTFSLASLQERLHTDMLFRSSLSVWYNLPFVFTFDIHCLTVSYFLLCFYITWHSLFFSFIQSDLKEVHLKDIKASRLYSLSPQKEIGSPKVGYIQKTKNKCSQKSSNSSN